MNKLLNNKKLLIIISLVLLLVIVIGAYVVVSTLNKNTGDSDPNIQSEENVLQSDEYIRDKDGNIKRVLIIDNLKYKLEMDLLGTWKEYLLPVDQRDKYQAFLIPDKNTDAIPYLYISIDESESVESKDLVEQEIIYELRNDFDSFELEHITKKTTNDNIKYIVSYKTTKNKEEIKNYQTIFYQDGYRISMTYSALSLAYSSEKGYIDDMIDTVTFKSK